MRILKSCYTILLKIMEVIAMIAVGLMVIIVFYSVISRFIINSSIAWAEEVSRFLMTWMTFVGGVLAFQENKLMSFDSLVNAFPKKLKYAITLASYVLIFVLLVNLTRGGITYASKSWSWASPAAHIPYGYVYAVAPVSLAIMALQCVIKFVMTFMTAMGKGETE